MAAPTLDTGRAGPADRALVHVANVSRSFVGVKAVQDVSFDVPARAIVGLIGPNGAGKTTLFNCLTGFLAVDSGEVWLADKRVDNRPPHEIARLGMVRTFQSIRMFAGLTVFESLLVGQAARHGRNSSAEGAGRDSRTTEARRVARQFGLGPVLDKPCAELGFLQQRRVEVARAIVGNPTVLLLDEPSAGATRGEADELQGMIKDLREAGTTILLIEHNVPFVMGLADHVVVMNFGAVVASGSPREIQQERIAQEVYLGA